MNIINTVIIHKILLVEGESGLTGLIRRLPIYTYIRIKGITVIEIRKATYIDSPLKW